MHWDGILKTKWNGLRGSIKGWWGRLSDDDIAKVEGKPERLISILQKRYGYTTERAWREIEGKVDPNATIPVQRARG
jgi:uncharacterized protein YjbJ (UPF0337 family)